MRAFPLVLPANELVVDVCRKFMKLLDGQAGEFLARSGSGVWCGWRVSEIESEGVKTRTLCEIGGEVAVEFVEVDL
jgi:hypothetical protein